MLTFSNHQMFASLSNQSFRRLWYDAWLWYGCRWMEIAVLSWLVLELTNSPSQVALVGIARMLPMILFGFLAGNIADRFPKRRVMAISRVVIIAAALCLVFILLSDAIQPWHTYVYMLIGGISWTVDLPARKSYFSDIVDNKNLENAVALDNVVLMGGMMLGPFIGGSLISIVGYVGTFVAIILMYFLGFLLLTVGLVPISKRVKPKQLLPLNNDLNHKPVEVTQGIHKNNTIQAVLMVTVSVNLFGFSYMQLVPVIARDVLGANSVLYGLLAGSAGLGATIGALILASRRLRHQGIIFSLGAMGMEVALLGFALSPVYLLSLVLLFFAGILLSGFTTLQPIIALNAAPPGMQGRAIGAVAMAIGALPFGTWMLGQLAELVGAQAALAMVTTVGFIVLNIMRWRFPSLRL